MLLLFERRGSQLLCQTDAVANRSLLRSEVIYVHNDSRFAQVRCTKGWSRVQGKGTTQQFPLGALILSIFCLITCPSFYQPYKKLVCLCLAFFLNFKFKKPKRERVTSWKANMTVKSLNFAKIRYNSITHRYNASVLTLISIKHIQQPVTAFNRTTINLRNAQVGTSIT